MEKFNNGSNVKFLKRRTETRYFFTLFSFGEFASMIYIYIYIYVEGDIGEEF